MKMVLIPKQAYSSKWRRPRRMPLAVFIAMLYFILVFVVVSLDNIDTDQASTSNRIPLVLGCMMLLATIPEVRRDLALPRGLIPLFLSFMAGAISSGMFGPSGLFEGIRSLFSEVGIGLTLLLTVHRPIQLRPFLTVALWVAVANALYGLIFMAPGLRELGNILTALGLPQGVSTDNEFRLVGFSGDPSYCGLILMTGFFISLERHMASRKKWISLTGLTSIMLCVCILLTVSRTSWFATLIGYLAWRASTKARSLYHLFFPMILAFFCYYFLGLVQEVMPTLYDKIDIFQDDTRTWIWKSYFNLALQRPLGYGIGSIEHLRKFATAGHLFYSTARPHNYFLRVWIEMGLQGLIPLLLMILIALKRIWPLRAYYDLRTREYPARLAMTLLVSLCVGLFSLGGLGQLLFISLALCFLSEIFVKRGELVVA